MRTSCLTAPQVDVGEAGVRGGEDEERRSGFPGQGARQRDRLECPWPARPRPACRSDRFRSPTTTRTGIRRPSISIAISKVVDEKVGSIVNAVNPDLSAFKARGGKLLLYHGWNDTAISPGNTINYYSSVLSKMGGKQDDFVRLFMAPGMQHCGGGPGPNQVNYMAALERWRESSIAPDTLDRVPRHQQPRRHDAAAVRVSAGGAVQGHGQHQRRRELRL